MSVRSRLENFLQRFERPLTVYNEIILHQSALVYNVELLSGLAPQNSIFPVLKSNAYGHGLREIAEMLQYKKFPYIAVDGYFEALAVHEVSDQPVLVMGAIASENFRSIQPKYCAFVVGDEQTIHAMGESGRKFTVHLEVDTGMTRHGVKPDQVMKYVRQIRTYPNLTLEGVMSHLADADNPDSSFTLEQVTIFDECVEKIINSGIDLKWVHIVQSAGTPKVRSKYANAVRTGIALYGISPLEKGDNYSKQYAKLKPVLELVSTVTKVHKIKKGTAVGYGLTYKAKRDTTIAVLPLGYYEGLPIELSNTRSIEINGKQHKIAGRVCMNITMVDVGDSKVKVGDSVTVISAQKDSKLSIESISRKYKLFSYGLMVGLDQSIRRTIKKVVFKK